jgi:hypothetical protein
MIQRAPAGAEVVLERWTAVALAASHGNRAYSIATS